MAKVKMKVSLAGSLRNAANAIEAMRSQLLSQNPYEQSDESEQADYHAFCLREIADHAEGTAKGEHSIEDFAEHYCLKK